jgi:hypothetical protein
MFCNENKPFSLEEMEMEEMAFVESYLSFVI